MKKPKIPTLKAIMAEKGCSINRARTYRAFYEADADMEYWRKTGRHFLEVITPQQYERNPSLATM